MKLKLTAFKRGERAHYNKTDAIVSDGTVIGEIEFSYGRSDSSDRWNVWEYVIRLPLRNRCVCVRTFGRASYTVEKTHALENIKRLINGAESNYHEMVGAYQGTREVTPNYEPFGSCVELTYHVLHGADLSHQGADKIKKLKYPLHPCLSNPSTLSQ